MPLALTDEVRFLVFPLVVLLAGAVVSGLLIPELTRRRDNHRKALEIKADLVSEMSEAVMEFMMAIQFAVMGARGQDQKAYDAAYRNWEVRSAVIGTKLEAYFPGASIGSDWGSFAERLTQFYALTGIQDPDDRRRVIDGLLAEYNIGPRDGLGSAVSMSQDAWGVLRDAILAEKSAMIRAVLESRADAVEARSLIRSRLGAARHSMIDRR